MIRAVPYLVIAALIVAYTAQTMSSRAIQAVLSATEAELASQVAIAEQASLARDIARAEADRQRVKAEEYEAVKNALRNGDFDAELPSDFRDILAGILRR